jgi:hypothetical protein
MSWEYLTPVALAAAAQMAKALHVLALNDPVRVTLRQTLRDEGLRQPSEG